MRTKLFAALAVVAAWAAAPVGAHAACAPMVEPRHAEAPPSVTAPAERPVPLMTSPGRQMNRDEPAPADLREQEVPTTYESWAGRSEGDDVWVQCGSYKKFTGGNFPHNLGVRAGTGNSSSPKGYHAHHNLPQKFQGYFSSRG